MSALRDEIRAILREEIAALRREGVPGRAPEVVHVSSSADLTRFARDLLARAASDPAFAAAVASGAQAFELSGGMAVSAAANYGTPAPRIVTTPAPPRARTQDLSKALVTERDIAAMEPGAKVLRVPKNCRLTPLANDEARRRGIRIERFAT
jgi:hypothetical protein